ncbi:MAG TPA: DUF2283 domain-containing protein [Acidimicrobiales bacterium]|nr:DUF2283 domain-containing protein [Acidimicrobiales bacterium]
MSVKLGDVTFDEVDYDAEADVLYLHQGDPSAATDFDESPEGHALRFDGDGALVGVTIVGAKRLLAKGGPIVVTVLDRLELPLSEVSSIIDAA